MQRTATVGLIASLGSLCACGPNVSNAVVTGASTDGETDSGGLDAESAGVRLAYPTDSGLVIRDVEDARLMQPQLTVTGDWDIVRADSRALVAVEDGEPRRQLVIPDLEPSAALILSSPTPDGIWTLLQLGPAWIWLRVFVPRLEVRALSLGDPESRPVFESEQVAQISFSADRYVLALESLPDDATRLLRVSPADGLVQDVLTVAADEDLRFLLDRQSRYAMVSSQDLEQGPWSSRLSLLDLSSDPVRQLDVPLLPGASSHGRWGPVFDPQYAGFVEVQGDDESGGNLAWVEFDDDGQPRPAVLVSTGPTEDGLSSDAAAAEPIVWSPDGRWLTFRARPAGQTVKQTFAVHWSDGVAGPPVLLGDAAREVKFADSGDFVSFISGPPQNRQIVRAELSGDTVAAPQPVASVGEDDSYFIMSANACVFHFTREDFTEAWLVDVCRGQGAPWNVAGCSGPNLTSRLSSDGSVLVCSAGEDRVEGRESYLSLVRTGEAVALPDATRLPHLVPLR